MLSSYLESIGWFKGRDISSHLKERFFHKIIPFSIAKCVPDNALITKNLSVDPFCYIFKGNENTEFLQDNKLIIKVIQRLHPQSSDSCLPLAIINVGRTGFLSRNLLEGSLEMEKGII